MFKRKKKNQPTTWVLPGGMKWTEADGILGEAHTLIAGETGCGKSTMIHTLMWSALSYAPSQKQFLLLDLKMGLELGRYARLPHVVGFARTAEEALSALDWAIAEMTRRCELMYQRGQVIWNGPDLYVVIDEFGFLLQVCGRDALDRVAQISRLGRAARIHLLLATQSPNRTKYGIPAVIQQNMTCKVGLRCSTAIESRQVIGIPGCEELPQHGQAIVHTGPNWALINAYKTPDEELTARIMWWLTPQLCTA